MPLHARRGCQPVCVPVCEAPTYSLSLPCTPTYGSVVVPSATIYSSSTPLTRAVDPDPVKRALGDKSYADVIPEIRDRLRSSLWATDKDKAEINYSERALKPGEKPGFSKEVTFDAKPLAVTPHFETIRYGHDDYGSPYRAEWKYQTGATNLLKIYGGDWEVKLDRSPDGHHYTVKLPEHFVGAVKITIDGKAHIVYSHATSESVPGGDSAKTTPKNDPPKKEVGGLKLPDPKVDPEVERERQKLAGERAELAKQQKELLAAQEKFKQEQQQQAEAQKQREQALEKQRQDLAKWKGELDETARGLHEQREAAKRERAELDGAKRKLAEGNADLTRREGDLAGERGKLDALKATLDTRSGELKAEAARLEGVKASLNGTEAKLAAQTGDLKQQQAALKDLKEGLEQQKQRQDQREAGLDKRGAELDGKEKELAGRERKLKEDEAGLAALDKKLKDDKQLDGDARKKLEAEQKELADRLKGEREQLERDRKSLGGLQEDLKKQREELAEARAGLAGVKADLDKRATALDQRQADLKTETSRLDDLRAQLDAREKALKAEAELKRDRSVAPLPPAPPAPEAPKIKWELANAGGDAPRPLGSPEVKLPAWIEYAATLSFERASLEAVFGRLSGGYESYLAGGDLKRAGEIEAEAEKLNDDKRKTFEAAKVSHAIHIEQAYKPLMDAHYNTQSAVVGLARFQARYQGKTPPPEETQEVLRLLVRAQASVDIALLGTDSTDVGRECNAGVGAKANKIRIDIGVLEKMPSRDKTEEARLAFLRDRLIRMEEAEKWLTALKPEIDRLAAGIALPKSKERPEGGINEKIDPLKIDLFGSSKSAPAPALGKDLETIKAPLAKLLAGEVSEESRAPIQRLGAVKAMSPGEVTSQLGNSDALAVAEINLEAVLAFIGSERYRVQLENRSTQAQWKQAAEILAATEPLPQRKAKLAAYFEATLGAKFTADERAKLEKGIDAFEKAPSVADRSTALLGIMEPVRAFEVARAKDDQTKAVDALKSALDVVKSGKATLALSELSKKTERAFLDFTSKVPECGDEATFAEANRDESKMVTAIADAKKAQALAIVAIDAELKELFVVTGGKVGTTGVHRRVEALQQRKKSMQRWLDRRNGKFTESDE